MMIFIACNQHTCWVTGGRVDGSDWLPGGLDGQLFDGKGIAYSRVVDTEFISINK